MDIKEFEKLPLMGILRGIKIEELELLVEAVCNSGLKTIEVAMNTPKATEIIKKISVLGKKRLTIGAGTVLNEDDLSLALENGASFIVSPVLVKQVADKCIDKNIPFFPGAFTPQEIHNAWQSGAAMVKVFPAKFFAPAYFKEIKAPLGNIKLLACGGVNEKSIGEYFNNGAAAVAFGASAFRKDWLERGDFSSLEKYLRLLVENYKSLNR